MRHTNWMLLFLAVGVFATPIPARAVATIDLTWDNCAFDNTPAHSQNVTFACNGSRDATNPYRLFATLRAPAGGYRGLAALQAQIDLQDESGTLPPFWGFEPGGCNEAYLAVQTTRPPTCGTTANNPWVPASDAEGFVLIFNRMGNRSRMEVVVTTLPLSAQNLASDGDYYLFDVAINEDSFINSPPGCTGCGSKVGMVFNSVKLESSAPFLNADPLVVSQSGSIGTCAMVNGASIAFCNVPTQNRTWGAVKALYR